MRSSAVVLGLLTWAAVFGGGSTCRAQAHLAKGPHDKVVDGGYFDRSSVTPAPAKRKPSTSATAGLHKNTAIPRANTGGRRTGRRGGGRGGSGGGFGGLGGHGARHAPAAAAGGRAAGPAPR